MTCVKCFIIFNVRVLVHVQKMTTRKTKAYVQSQQLWNYRWEVTWL